MEVHLRVEGEDPLQRIKYNSNKAFFTFVALDPTGRPQRVPPVEPEDAEEKELYEGAMRRRQVRLILGDKMKPEDARELKSFLMKG
jgi:acyl-CoA hydrolase